MPKIEQDRHARELRQGEPEHLDKLRRQVSGKIRHARDVAAGTREARHEAAADRISGARRDDRNARRCVLRGEGSGRAGREDRVGLGLEQLRSETRQRRATAFCETRATIARLRPST